MSVISDPTTGDPATRKRWNIWAPRTAILIAMGCAIFFLAASGLRFRRSVWDMTAPIRVTQDIDRNYTLGRAAATDGYLNQYERMQAEQPTDDDGFDCAPLRLAVLTLWGKWSINHFPQVQRWHDEHSFQITAPLLHFNVFMEMIGLISAFFLVRLWSVRIRLVTSANKSRGSLRLFFRGWTPGLLAALLLWWNPAIIISGYGWSTGDLCVVPMFLLAALLASLDWWFVAGAVLGIGMMLQGQQSIAVPIFAMWSLVLGQPMRTFHFFSGVIIVVAIIASPWLITYIPADKLALAHIMPRVHGQQNHFPASVFQSARVADFPAILWVLGILVATAAAPWIGWLQLTNVRGKAASPRWRNFFASPWAWKAIAALSTILLVMWPWWIKRNHGHWIVGVCAAFTVAVAVLTVRPRGIPALCAAAFGLSLLWCMSLFHGTTAWYDLGVHFVTGQSVQMSRGMTDNLPAILSTDFGWSTGDRRSTALTLPARLIWRWPAVATDISMNEMLLTFFWITLLLCGVGAGLHARRKDPRLLIALTGGWLVYFCFLPQNQGAYMLFAGGISCICTGVSAGMTLVGMFLTLEAALMTLHSMLAAAGWKNVHEFGRLLAGQYPSLFADSAGSKLLALANGTHPDLGYAVILCTFIFLYFGLAIRSGATTKSSVLSRGQQHIPVATENPGSYALPGS